MLSKETINESRQMTVAKRADLVLAMIRGNASALRHGPPEVVDSRFEVLRRQNDERNRRIREGMARAGRCEEKPRPIRSRELGIADRIEQLLSEPLL